jgi:hypothetical protein
MTPARIRTYSTYTVQVQNWLQISWMSCLLLVYYYVFSVLKFKFCKRRKFTTFTDEVRSNWERKLFYILTVQDRIAFMFMFSLLGPCRCRHTFHGVILIFQRHLYLCDILLWYILLWDILLQLYTSILSVHKSLVNFLNNTLGEKYLYEHFKYVLFL